MSERKMGELISMIKYVSCTRKNKQEFFTSTSLGKSISRRVKDIDQFFHNNCIFIENTEGLGKRYNQAINSISDYREHIFVFVHDDVTLNDIYMEDNINSYISEYDIMGVAGTKKFNIQSPIIWNQHRDFFVGYVTQRHENKYWSCNFGMSPSKAIIIDGLFMAVKGTVFDTIKFDEQFNFHHYDIDFCLTAFENKIKTGVIPVNIIHDSIGDWKNDPKWADSEKLFLKKWCK